LQLVHDNVTFKDETDYECEVYILDLFITIFCLKCFKVFFGCDKIELIYV